MLWTQVTLCSKWPNVIKKNYKYCILKYYQILEYSCLFRTDFYVPVSEIQTFRKLFTQVWNTWTFACRCKLRSILKCDSLPNFMRMCFVFFYSSVGSYAAMLLSLSYKFLKFTLLASLYQDAGSLRYFLFSYNCHYLICSCYGYVWGDRM